MAKNFTLNSETLRGQAEQAQMFKGMNCMGDNISPQLWWEDAPKGTRSFAITIHDSKAPTLSGWWHWIMVNIPAEVTELKEDAGDINKSTAPEGCIQGRNDFGGYGYGGPCPPEGDSAHPYIITVYALDVEDLGVSRETPAASISFAIEQHAIEKASLVVYAKR